MLRSQRVIRVSASVLTAQTVVQQTLEVLTGEKIKFHDLIFSIGKENELPLPRGYYGEDADDRTVATRCINVKGTAQGKTRFDFSFDIGLHLTLNGKFGWLVSSEYRPSLLIEKEQDPKWYTVYWTYTDRSGPATVHVIPRHWEPDKEHSMWTVGTGLHDRHEEPLFPEHSQPVAQ